MSAKQEAISKINENYQNGKRELIIKQTMVILKRSTVTKWINLVDQLMDLGIKYEDILEAKLRNEGL